MKTTAATFSDQELAIFVDGQADAILAEKISAALESNTNLCNRLETMSTPVAAIQNALNLAALDAPEMPRKLAVEGVKPAPRFVTGMAIAASFAAGMVVMNFVRPSPDWIERVASYQALYVEDTLMGDVQDPALTQLILIETQQRLGINFATAPALNGMAFKRVQTLAIEDEPLIQLAYLADDGTPFALCIVRVDQSDQGIKTERTHDLATASWIDDGVGYVLIGGSDIKLVSDLAMGLAEQI